MNEEDSEVYDFDELITKLVDIKDQGTGYINYPKAFLTLAKEIQNLRNCHESLSDCYFGVDD